MAKFVKLVLCNVLLRHLSRVYALGSMAAGPGLSELHEIMCQVCGSVYGSDTGCCNSARYFWHWARSIVDVSVMESHPWACRLCSFTSESPCSKLKNTANFEIEFGNGGVSATEPLVWDHITGGTAGSKKHVVELLAQVDHGPAGICYVAAST